jgi:hypothetical protein
MLIPFRKDASMILNDVNKLMFRSTFGFIMTVILLFIFLPPLIIDTIYNLKKDV